MNGNQPWAWLTDLFLGETTTDTSPQPTRINVASDGAHDQRHRINQATDTTPINRSGSHIQEIVSSAHRAVIGLTEQDAADQTEQSTRRCNTHRAALHISELADE